jgi:hypothetical protein
MFKHRCQECGKSFVKLQGLVGHCNRTGHPRITGRRVRKPKWPCQKCGVRFFTQVGCRRHERACPVVPPQAQFQGSPTWPVKFCPHCGFPLAQLDLKGASRDR